MRVIQQVVRAVDTDLRGLWTGSDAIDRVAGDERSARALREAFPMRHDYHVVYTTIEDGWIMATVPELPGAVTQGRDLDEARANIREAVELVLQSYRENAAKDAPGSAIWETLSVEVPAS